MSDLVTTTMNKIQSFCCFPSIQSIPDDHFFSINKEQKKVVFNLLSSSQKMFSFTHIELKDSNGGLLNSLLPPSIVDSLLKGYSTAVISISDDHEPFSNAMRLSHNIQEAIYSEKRVNDTSVEAIAISAFMIMNDSCYDLLSNTTIDIKETKDTREVVLEELSSQTIQSTMEGDSIIKTASENYNKTTEERRALFIRFSFTLKQLDVESNQLSTYFSKLDLVSIPFNAKSFIKDKDSNDNRDNIEDQLTIIINAVNFPNGRNSFESSFGLSLLFREYFGGGTKTDIILSLNEIMQLSKEETNAVFSFLSNAMSIKTHAIPKEDSKANLLLYKRLYHQLINQPRDRANNAQGDLLISQIKELLTHQHSMSNALRRFPSISIGTLNDITKYKEDCEHVYGTNCSEIMRYKLLLEDAFNECNAFNQNIIMQNECNGQVDIDYIKAMQLFSEKMDLLIDSLQMPLKFKNTDKLSQLEREAYLSLMNYYSLRENAPFSCTDEESEVIVTLMHRLIDVSEDISRQLLQGKVIDSYEVIEKVEFGNMVKQLNESKFNEQQKVYEANDSQKTLKDCLKEIEELKNKISIMKRESPKNYFFEDSGLGYSSFKIECKGKTTQRQHKSVNEIAQCEIQSVSLSEFSITPSQLTSPKLSPSIKVKTKNNENHLKLNKFDHSNCKAKSFFITKADSFTFFKDKTRNRNSICKLKQSSINHRLKVKQQASIEYLVTQKHSSEFLKKQLEEKVSEIKHLKLFNEYTTRQKEFELSSCSSQLNHTKQKLLAFEEEIRELTLTKDYLMKENALLKTERKQMNTIPYSPHKPAVHVINEAYSASKKAKPTSIKCRKNKRMNKINKSLEIQHNKNNNGEERVLLKKDFKNDSCELTSNSRENAELSRTPRVIMVNKIIGEPGLNDSAIRLLEEIREDNGLLLNELSMLKCKNNEIANDIKKLSQGNNGSSEKKKKSKPYSTYNQSLKKDWSRDYEKD